jgi:GNAT superfamily N-acetyltransferase
MDHSTPPDSARGPYVWRAERHEADAVARLLVAFRDHIGTAWPPADAFLSGVERLIDDPATEYLLAARHRGAPAAGVAQLRYRWAVWRVGYDCLLEDLFVAPEARGGGLGRALVQATIEHARARDCRRIELDTAERNEGALALYRSAGFDDRAYEGGRALFLRLRLE